MTVTMSLLFQKLHRIRPLLQKVHPCIVPTAVHAYSNDDVQHWLRSLCHSMSFEEHRDLPSKSYLLLQIFLLAKPVGSAFPVRHRTLNFVVTSQSLSDPTFQIPPVSS